MGHGRVVAKEFFDRRRDPLRASAQGISGLRVSKQCNDAVADEARGRVVSRNDQLKDRREQFALVEPLVAVASEDQRAHEIVTRCALLRLDERAEHRDDLI